MIGRRIVQRVLAEQPLLRLLELVLGLDDQEEIVARLGNDPVGDRARDVDVVARLEIERSEIRFDFAAPAMDEVKLVAIRVAEVKGHRVTSTGDRKPDIVVSKKCRGQTFGIVQIAGLELIQIEAVRPQLAFKANPSGGRMGVVKMRGFAVKALAAVFFFESALGQADMGLIGGFAFFERIHVALHLPVYGERLLSTTCMWCSIER